jgi:hypothetical protein
MQRTRRNQTTPADEGFAAARAEALAAKGQRPGFAIEIGPDTDLRGEGLLIYEYASGGYAPVAAVSTPNEAQEIAASYQPEAAGAFTLWARGILGRYLIVPIQIDGKRR